MPASTRAAAALNGPLLEWALRKEAAESGRVATKSNVGGYQSAADVFDDAAAASSASSPPCVRALHAVFSRAVEQLGLAEAYPVSASRPNPGSLHALTGWLNVNRDADFNALHVHVPERWSAIYYVSAGAAGESPDGAAAPTPDGHLVFRAGVATSAAAAASEPPPPPSEDDDAALAAAPCAHYAVRPVPGTLWLFPGAVPHAVLGCRPGAHAAAPRVSLAANFRDAAPYS